MSDTGFLFIPEFIMERDDLLLQEKCVYGRIVGLTKKEGYCYITNEVLGEKVGLSGERVKKIISKLNRLGLLRIEVERYTKENLPPGEAWFTKRKIYIFENFAPPVGVVDDPQVGVVHDPHSNIDNRGQSLSEKPIIKTPEELASVVESDALEEHLRKKEEIHAKKKTPFLGFGGGRMSSPRPAYQKKERTYADGRGIR